MDDDDSAPDDVSDFEVPHLGSPEGWDARLPSPCAPDTIANNASTNPASKKAVRDAVAAAERAGRAAKEAHRSAQAARSANKDARIAAADMTGVAPHTMTAVDKTIPATIGAGCGANGGTDGSRGPRVTRKRKRQRKGTKSCYECNARKKPKQCSFYSAPGGPTAGTTCEQCLARGCDCHIYVEYIGKGEHHRGLKAKSFVKCTNCIAAGAVCDDREGRCTRCEQLAKKEKLRRPCRRTVAAEWGIDWGMSLLQAEDELGKRGYEDFPHALRDLDKLRNAPDRTSPGCTPGAATEAAEDTPDVLLALPALDSCFGENAGQTQAPPPSVRSRFSDTSVREAIAAGGPVNL